MGRKRSQLEFEEQALGPVLAVVDHWGPERLRAMHEEHGRQRSDLAALLEEIDGGAATERLGAQFLEVERR